MGPREEPSKVDYHLPWNIRFNRAFFLPIFRLLFHFLGKVEIIGKENIPNSGAYLVAMNHVSIYDPPFILSFWPKAPEALGAVEIWTKKGQSTLARLYGGIPVRRREYDRESLERVLAALAAGRPLVIAPEGGRSHTPGLRQGLPGIAYIIEKSHVPVVPVGITGTTEDFFQQGLRGKRPRLSMKIGRPIIFNKMDDISNRRIIRQQNVDQIMVEIARLLPEDYRGVYSLPVEE